MKTNGVRKRTLYRALSLAFAFIVLLQSGALVPPALAVEADPTTGTITLYRWDRADDAKSYTSASGNGIRFTLLTWQDNGELYYFRSALHKYTWSGSAYNGSFVLNNAQVSTQPIMAEALRANSATFFSTTMLDARLAYVNNMLFGGFDPGESRYEGFMIQYDGSSGALAKPTTDSKYHWLVDNKNGGIQFRSRTNMKDQSYGSYLKHSGNQISGTTINDESTVFNKPYVATEYQISAIAHDYAITDGQVTHLDNSGTYLAKGATLTVRSGGVLSIGGTLLNDGKIVVEKGGLLLLKPGATVVPLTRSDAACGGIASRGTVIIRSNAKLIGGGANGVYLTGGIVDNYGLIASENFQVKSAYTVHNHTGAKIYAGKTMGYVKMMDALAANLDTKPSELVEKDGVYYRKDGTTVTLAVSGITDSDMTTFLNSANVLMIDGAIVDKGGSFTDFGSRGAAVENDPIVKIYVGSDPGGNDRRQALIARKSELRYYPSEPSYCTVREYLERIGMTDQCRAVLRENGQSGSDEELELFLTQTYGDLDAITEQRHGYFTVNGSLALTIPWYNRFDLYENETCVSAGIYPDQKGIDAMKAAGYSDGSPLAGVTLSDGTTLPCKVFELEPACAPGMRLEIGGGSTYYGTGNAQLGAPNGAAYQRWEFTRAAAVQENGEMHYYYSIRPIHWRHLLGPYSSSPANGTNVVQLKSAASNRLMWRLIDNGDGTYGLVNRANQALRLNVANAGTAAGTNVNMATANENDAMKWRLIPVD